MTAINYFEEAIRAQERINVDILRDKLAEQDSLILALRQANAEKQKLIDTLLDDGFRGNQKIHHLQRALRRNIENNKRIISQYEGREL